MTAHDRAIRAVLLALPCDLPWSTRRLDRTRVVEVQRGRALGLVELLFRWWREVGGDPELLAPLGGLPGALEQLGTPDGLGFLVESDRFEEPLTPVDVHLTRAGSLWLAQHEPVAI